MWKRLDLAVKVGVRCLYWVRIYKVSSIITHFYCVFAAITTILLLNDG